MRLDDSPPVQVDVIQFQALIDQWQAHDHLDPAACDSCIASLRQATDMVSGDFLADFYLADSNAFEEWAGLQREQLRQFYLQALDSLADFYLASGDVSAAQAIAYRQIEADNLREKAYRQLMIALAHDGERSAALRVYADLERLLLEELAVGPEGATSALAEQIRNGEWEPQFTKATVSTSEERKLSQTPAAAQVLSIAESPYRGLYAFREEDADLFFGREEFTEQLLTATSSQSLVAVVGPSGSGKTSVVHAGLLSQLRSRSDLAIASFRPTSNPVGALAEAILPLVRPYFDRAEQLAKALIDQETTLIKVVKQIKNDEENRRLLLMVDQFEELYTRCSDPITRQLFLDILLESVFDQQYRPAPIFTLVITLRADFLNQALTYRPLADALRDTDVKLGPMTAAELGQTIKKPALAHGVSFESGLVARIRDDVADEPGNLPLLEFALEMLWARQENGFLSHAAYEAIGRVEGALTRYADEVYHNLSPQEQTVARRIFIQLVRPGEGTGDTRRVTTRAELGETDWTIVQVLADARLLTTSSDAGGLETVEVVHEALINGWNRLQEWMLADREFRLWQERLRVTMGQWQANGHDEGALLRGSTLDVAERWLGDRPADLSLAEKDYIKASLDLRERLQTVIQAEQSARERSRRRLAYAGAMALAIMALLALMAILQWRQADAQRQVAEAANQEALTQLASRLSTNARNLPLDQLDVSLLLSVEANQLVDNDFTQLALNEILERNPALLQHGQLPFNPFAVTVKNGPPLSDGRLYLHTDGTSAVTKWAPDWQNARLAQEESIPFPAEAVAEGKILHHLTSSDDNTLLAMVFCREPVGQPCYEPQIALWQADREVFADLEFRANDQTLTAMAISPDGSWLAHGNVDGSIVLWDTSLGRSIGRALVGHADAISLLAISPNGDWLASWSRDGLISLWDISHLPSQPVAQFGGHNSAASLVFSPDSNLLLSAGQSDDRLFVWELKAVIDGGGSPSWLLNGPLGGSFLAEFSPDGRWVLAGGNNGQIFHWVTAALDQTSPKPASLQGHSDFISAFFYNSDDTLLSLAPDATILWDLSGASLPRRMLEGHQQHVVDLEFSPGDKMLLSAACDLVGSGGPCSAAEFLAWDINSASLITSSVNRPGGEIWATKFISGGDLALLGTLQDGKIELNPAFPPGAPESVKSLPLPLIHASGMSPSDQVFATGHCQEVDLSIPQCLVSALTLWGWPSGTLQHQALSAHKGLVENLAFSPDGGTVATVGEDGKFLLWEVVEGELTSRQINGDSQVVDDALALSPDGSKLAGAGCGLDEADGSCLAGAVWLWDIDSGEQLGNPLILDETVFVFSLAFTPDGRHLVVGDGAGTITFWKADTGEHVLQIPAHTGPVMTLRFSHDGRLLASGGTDRSINLFNVDRLLAQIERPSSEKIDEACLRAGRNLSSEEWSAFFGDIPYRVTCPDNQF